MNGVQDGYMFFEQKEKIKRSLIKGLVLLKEEIDLYIIKKKKTEILRTWATIRKAAIIHCRERYQYNTDHSLLFSSFYEKAFVQNQVHIGIHSEEQVSSWILN